MQFMILERMLKNISERIVAAVMLYSTKRNGNQFPRKVLYHRRSLTRCRRWNFDFHFDTQTAGFWGKSYHNVDLDFFCMIFIITWDMSNHPGLAVVDLNMKRGTVITNHWSKLCFSAHFSSLVPFFTLFVHLALLDLHMLGLN